MSDGDVEISAIDDLWEVKVDGDANSGGVFPTIHGAWDEARRIARRNKSRASVRGPAGMQAMTFSGDQENLA